MQEIWWGRPAREVQKYTSSESFMMQISYTVICAFIHVDDVSVVC